MRSGSACISDSGRTPIEIPMVANTSPHAPRLNATGKPMSRKTKRPTNMMGAMLAAMNCMVRLPSGFLLLFLERREAGDLLGQFLLGRFRLALARRVFD